MLDINSVKSDIEMLLAKMSAIEASADKTDNRAMSLIYRTCGDLHQAKANIIELIEHRRKDALNAEEIHE